jgi:hypothetical protein
MLVLPSLAAACPGCCSGSRNTETGGYCQGRSASPPSDARTDGLGCTGALEDATCLCHAEPQQQSIPPERQAIYTPPDLLDGLPNGGPPFVETLADQTLRTESNRASLAPTIPSRILYCSWLI